MAETSGVDPEIVSLPKGGGAVRPLGATFDADLNTGTGQYSVPIELPAGPNGIRPEVTLRYASTHGNGPFGFGWGVALLAIARQTDGSIPRYDDSDRFVLAGGEELVADSGGRFRPSVDTSHWRIERVEPGWQVLDTHGVAYRLGASSHSRIENPERSPAAAAVWLLDEMADANGHRVRYEYGRDGVQRYLELVRWGTYELRLIYEERPDPITSGRYGFLVQTARRCARLELHVVELAPSLVRSWQLEYRQAVGSNASLLVRILQLGHGADGATLAAPPLRFEYSEPRRPALGRREPDPAAGPPPSFGSRRIELVDWDGDGLPDLLELHRGRARVWPNLGGGRWGRPFALPRLPLPIALDEPGVAFADMVGNGTADLIWMNQPLAGYYPLRPGGGFERPRFWRQTPGTPLGHPSARLVDLDGDGVVDLLVTGDRFFELHYRDGEGWARRPALVPRSQAPPVSLADSRVHLADMNGDGLVDLVHVSGAGVSYWPYLGYGRWDTEVRLRPSPRLPQRIEASRLRLVDLDGDGCSDLVYLDFDRVLFWRNRSGASLGEPEEVGPTPPALPEDVRWADLDGRGSQGLLWSPQRAGGGKRQYFLDFSGGEKAYLLALVDNGVGQEIQIRYTPSTALAADDAARGAPWRTFRPFPIHCVTELEQHDVTTGTTRITRYRYRDARYDPQRRAFLGFGRVEVEQVGDDTSPSLLTRCEFHVGLDPANPDRPLADAERLEISALRRRLLRNDVYGLDGDPHQDRPYQTVEHEYEVRIEMCAGGPVAVPLLRRSLETRWERAAQPFGFREVRYLDHDEFGNVVRQHTRAWRAGVEAPDLELEVETSYARNLERNLVAAPARMTTRDGEGALLGVQVRLYDGDPHVGSPEGEITTGNLTASYRLAVTDDLAAEVYGEEQPDWQALGYLRRPGEGGWWVREHSYERSFHEQGLTLRTRGPRGFDTTLEYDSTLQFPRGVTDAAGNTVRASVDARAMQVAALVDANGHESSDRFDLLGRVTAMVTPGTSDARPSTRIEYRSAELPVRIATFQLERHDGEETLDRFDYWDGSGRLLQQVVEGEGDAGRRFLATETISCSARGMVAARYLPFYQDDPDYHPPPPSWPRQELRYDALGRLVERRKPDGSRVTQRFQPGLVLGFDERENAKPEVERRPLLHRLDRLDRVLEVERTVGGEVLKTSYRYDHEGRLLEATSTSGGVSRYSYDLLGRILVEQTPATGRTVYRLDAAGNQVGRRTASGKVSTSRYDALNRLLWTRQGEQESPELEYSYLDGQDPAPPDGARNRRARPWRVRDALGSLTLAYDQAGRVVQRRRRLVDQPDHELITDVEYDALGRQVRVVLPGAAPGAPRRVVQTLFNRRGLPASSPGLVRGAEYDPLGNAVRVVFQNGVENQLEIDAASGRPARLVVLGPEQQVLRDQRFTFDVVGNLLRIDSPLAAEALLAEYDDAARLIRASYGAGDVYSWEYDGDGSVTRTPELGDLVLGGPAGSGQVAAAAGQSYAWDPDGHLAAAPWGSLRFDALDNLVSIELSAGGRIDYRYDHRGLRASRRGPDGKMSIYADESLELHDGVPLFWIEFGDRRIQVVDGEGHVLFLHADLWGTPTLFTGLAGQEAARLGVTPYGSLRFATGTLAIPEPLRFTGQGADVDTALVVLGRRFYDPRLARFVSPDPMVGGLFRLDAWNRYVYAHDNPLRFVDPTGSDAAEVFGWLGVALMAIAAGALIAAGFITGGATWALAGVVGSMMYGAGVGMITGMVLGGIAAYVEGGNVLHGMLFGMMAGGITGLFGGLFGSAAGGAVGSAAAQVMSKTAATYFSYIVHGTIAGALAGFGTGATLGFAGGKGSVESMLEHMWKGAILGGVIGGLMGLGAAYIEANPYLNISTQKFEAMKQGTWNAIDWSQKQTGTLGMIRIATSAGDVYKSTGFGALGMFVGLGAKEAGLSFSLKWTVPLLMNIGVHQAPSMFLAFDKYEVITLGQAVRFGITLAPFGWLHEVTGFWDTSFGQDISSGLDTFYPKAG